MYDLGQAEILNLFDTTIILATSLLQIFTILSLLYRYLPKLSLFKSCANIL